MSKKHNTLEVSVKSTKEQILTAYNEVLNRLTEKQPTPQEQKVKEEEQNIIKKTAAIDNDNIIADLSDLKSKTIKQIDNLSEQLLGEFQKLANIREAITIEQKHLQDLYQINENANTLSALLQAHLEQKEKLKSEIEATRQAFEHEMSVKKTEWGEQKTKLEQEYKEKREILEKSRKREEEEYTYNLELTRRKELDEYRNQKLTMDKELSDLKDDLLKRETGLLKQEEHYELLKIQVEQIPDRIKQEITDHEEQLRTRLLEQYEFESKLKQQEYEGQLKLKDQNVNYLLEKVKEQEAMIKELVAKADMAINQVQSIACKALDTSAQRFVTTSTTNSTKSEEKN